MPQPVPAWETRSIEELRRQFDVERELAARLREARDRRGLYTEVYDEFLRRVPHYRTHDAALNATLVALQLRLLEPFLKSRPRFLEVGGAGAALTTRLADRLPRVIAVEATPIETAAVKVEVVVCDTPPYPIPDGSVDLAFSSHTIEHLVPADVLLHLQEMRRVLSPGGRYVCVTPNRLWGPHDVSRYFSDTPAGLHLHEYTHNELLGLMVSAGFRTPRIIARLGGTGGLVPHLVLRAVEGILGMLPVATRRSLLEWLSRGRQAPLRFLEQVMVVGTA
jgi:SAM-dependent methyltransferase